MSHNNPQAEGLISTRFTIPPLLQEFNTTSKVGMADCAHLRLPLVFEVSGWTSANQRLQCSCRQERSTPVPSNNLSTTGIRRSWWTPDFNLGAEYARHILEEDVSWLPHTHAEYSFVFCLGGQMEFVCGGRHHVLNPGGMLVHNAGQVHQSRYRPDQTPCEGITLVIYESGIESLLRRMGVCIGRRQKGFCFLARPTTRVLRTGVRSGR